MANILSLPILLKELRLSAIAKEWEVLAQKAVSQEWEPELFLAELCELEANHRHESRLKRLLKESKLPVGKQLHQYKFDEIEGITSLQMKQKVNQIDWLRQGHNILLFGASGLGKTHLACAIGYSLLEKAVRVKFSTSTAIVQELQRAKETLGLTDALRKLDKYELLILDDIGYVKKTDSESQVLFELIAHRYERGSLLITSNQAFSEWDSIFGDNMMTVAAIDRLVHHSDIYQIKGESYRKKQAMQLNSNTGQVN
ncbi:AAA family ATPase [Colwellia sp. PAMC 20917]|jgi:DNA replication protein DnaC|uniref:IS21-like element helper ATPase IstB n=3 Tax=Colwellia TaxID=28228 RepID=UPI000878A473|nr:MULTISPECIES: IS21-like element helper ATPase IstB [unclassified Colwellia]MBA6362250.1 ATP-binding protein [Colwellia sp. BRX8-8]AOW75409.1 AAA family ATPase [Colwellia sp. PAMC 20917]AOW75421.1 AAA family ATPase [Colwellia sp. PAMC 20917]AOW75669.1 AAA family ATPase [Colwellia sp. PAMC 20917]AOW76700.1 AAA family ATPase [Colwellia sp. PAMC 20917]